VEHPAAHGPLFGDACGDLGGELLGAQRFGRRLVEQGGEQLLGGRHRSTRQREHAHLYEPAVTSGSGISHVLMQLSWVPKRHGTQIISKRGSRGV
jgi:hypothetical protein